MMIGIFNLPWLMTQYMKYAFC